MKKESFFLLFFLLLGNSIFAQEKLNVFLDKNPTQKLYVDLVFENLTSEYILVPTTFEDLTFGGERSGHSIIRMQFFYNGQQICLNFGTRRPNSTFFYTFGWGSKKIAPYSSIRLPFYAGRIAPPYPRCFLKKLEVNIIMTHLFLLVEREGAPKRITFLVTNRIAIADLVGAQKNDKKECDNSTSIGTDLSFVPIIK